MRRIKTVVASVALVVVTNIVMVATTHAQQTSRPLRPPSPGGLAIIPFMEGWYANEDGTVTDYQTRIYRNTEDVTWMNKVHERITGYLLFRPTSWSLWGHYSRINEG